MMSGNDRDYCAYIDGTCNFYILTKESDYYQVWNIDEQTAFSSNWFRFAKYEEDKLRSLGHWDRTFNVPGWSSKHWKFRNERSIKNIIDGFKCTNHTLNILWNNEHSIDLIFK